VCISEAIENKRTIELNVTSKEPEIYLYKRTGVICRVGERGAKG
jgi:hypothetical protein